MLLACILIFMAFRIGKSVILYFGNNLELIFVLIGLSFLLLIGPLLRWYFKGMLMPSFKLAKYNALELLPFVLCYITSVFIPNATSTNRLMIVLFGSMLVGIYLHLIAYIIICWLYLKKTQKQYVSQPQLKSRKVIFKWLNLLVVGSIVIWVTYVLNVIENNMPYIIGPIMYSLVVYFLSIKAYQLKVTDIDGNAFKVNNDIRLFEEISNLITASKLYLEPNTSLSSLSKASGKSVQKISEVINQYANQNYNDFINHFRINDVKEKLVSDDVAKDTISSIAFSVGFSSLSSFNSAFKKFEGITPSEYKKKFGAKSRD